MNKRYPHLYGCTECIMCNLGCDETASHLFLEFRNTISKREKLRKDINTLIARELKGTIEIIPLVMKMIFIIVQLKINFVEKFLKRFIYQMGACWNLN